MSLDSIPTFANCQDQQYDSLIPLRDVPKLPILENVRPGKRLHISTIWRWANRGVRGRKLGVVRVGGTVCTSVSALKDFFEGSASLSSPRDESHPSRVSRSKHQKSIEDALNKLGI